MNQKNIFLVIAGVIIYKLLNSGKSLTLKNNARLLVDNGDQYKAEIYSSKPITATLIKKNNSHNFAVKLKANAADDFVVNGIPNIY